MPRDWDGSTYDRIADPMTRWGQAVLGRLALAGDEHVLDAGCGSGRVTEGLLDRLPGGRVTGLDGSPRMVLEAKRRLAAHAARVHFVIADLRATLPLRARFDAVLSTATFHWIPDHGALFRQIASVLRPGGQLVAQCGGAGNIASVMRALRMLGVTWHPWTYATPEETRVRLAEAGFVAVDTWLHEEPTAVDPGPALETFLATVILGSHLERLADSEREPFVRAIAQALPRPEIDYVRLNIVARRGGDQERP